MSNISRYESDESTEKTRKIVFAIVAVGFAFVPFIVYSTFFQKQTEIVYVGQATQDQLKFEREKGQFIIKSSIGDAAMTEDQMFCMNKNNDDLSKCLK